MNFERFNEEFGLFPGGVVEGLTSFYWSKINVRY